MSASVLENRGGWLVGSLYMSRKRKVRADAVVVEAGGGVRGVVHCVVKECRGLTHLRGPSLPAFSCLGHLQALLKSKRYSVVLGASG